MSGPGFSIETRGLDEQIRAVAKFARLITDLRTLWPRCSSIFIVWMRRQFDTEGEFGGDPWEPLSPGYAAWKAKARPGKGILRFDGDLRQSASRPKRATTPTTLTLSFDGAGKHHGPIAGFHQAGTDRMPARPLIFSTIPAEAKRDLDSIAEAHVQWALIRSGLLSAAEGERILNLGSGGDLGAGDTTV